MSLTIDQEKMIRRLREHGIENAEGVDAFVTMLAGSAAGFKQVKDEKQSGVPVYKARDSTVEETRFDKLERLARMAADYRELGKIPGGAASTQRRQLGLDIDAMVEELGI